MIIYSLSMDTQMVQQRVNIPQTLRASHIVAWASDKTNR